jgi:hypothetical protein
VCGGGGFQNLRTGGVWTAEGDVLGDGVGEKVGFLGNEADGAAKVGEPVAADGTILDEDGAVGCVEEARDQRDQG